MRTWKQLLELEFGWSRVTTRHADRRGLREPDLRALAARNRNSANFCGDAEAEMNRSLSRRETAPT
jgi:hypothetical protein